MERNICMGRNNMPDDRTLLESDELCMADCRPTTRKWCRVLNQSTKDRLRLLPA